MSTEPNTRTDDDRLREEDERQVARDMAGWDGEENPDRDLGDGL